MQTITKMQEDGSGVDKSLKFITFGEKKKTLNAGAYDDHTV